MEPNGLENRVTVLVDCDNTTPKKYGHSGFLEMVQTYPELSTRKDGGGHWVTLKKIQRSAPIE
ncbi:hypothetical protein [Limnobacter sp.]|uniref:hypothetical protein n=1 Tax=Limnobacter sp. TaxID=2003368 RepID=UPI00351121FE